MIIPIKCFTCGNVLADKYLYYIKEVRQIKMNEGMNTEEVVYLDEEKMEKILIVDDEESILAPLEEMLKGEGFRVRAFDNPLKALELLRTQEFDLAIFDIKMPCCLMVLV